jgi:hypothetical protein
LLASLALLFSAPLVANECLDLFPYDTVADGLPKICQSNFNGINKTYSCQDYRSGKTRYRILYKGGLSPKAVLQLNLDLEESLLSSPLFGDKRLRCPLNSPEGVPRHATHRGMGVCYDENDQMVACSVYEHAVARQSQAHRFMIFYRADEKNPVSIDATIAGTNNDAMVAEMAYQMGMSLWDTKCCAEQALEYLAYAYSLFPRAVAYRQAYQYSRTTLALRELD